MDTKILTDYGIDVNHGIELLGDIYFYNETMNDFLSAIDEKKDNLKKYKEENDFENYGILSHSIKSECKYLGFMKLADTALNHELAGKEKNETFIKENYDKFINEIDEIVNVCNKYLGR